MSTFYVLILSDDYVIRSILSTVDEIVATDFYNNEIVANFATTYPVTVETFNLTGIITKSRLLYVDMTPTQQTNISAYGFTVVQFILVDLPPAELENANITIGNFAGESVENLGPLIAIGRSAGRLAQKTNTLIGYSAGSSLTTGSANCCLGSASGTSLATTYSNTLIGEGVGVGYIGSNGVCIGASTTKIGQNTTYNVVIGGGLTGFSLSTGSRNVVIGGSSGFQLSTGANNVIVGNSGGQLMSTGSNNVCIGASARAGTTGTGNVVIGRSAGTSLTTGVNNICISATGSSADTGTIRIGTNGTHTKTFLQGVYGNIAPSGLWVALGPTGEMGTVLSSRRYKKNIQPLTNGDIVYKLRPVSFTYNNEPDDVVHYGLIAEDVQEVDPKMAVMIDGRVETIRYESLAPLLIDTIQKLNNRVDNLSQTINEIKLNNKILMQRVMDLERLIYN